MKCERCGKDASVSVKAIVNGYEHDFYLCNDCLKKYTDMSEENGIPNEEGFHKINLNNKKLESLIQKFIPSLDDMIDGYYEYKYNQNNHPYSYMEGLNQKACPNCGNLESNIRNGIFGCKECYKLSDNLSRKVLKTYNNYDKYTGKFPKKDREFKQVALEIKNLQEKLDLSIATEDYEQAADLKEQIDDLNMKVKN
ncbi:MULTISPECIES: UvrB/UvrC motif-containing protein [Anaerococcus]|uniref:UvrB/UvrC motif-containing protein n=1 Tax=Anaerococcus TaxID=165779 RepID=UPI0027B936C0|nr:MULTISPECIES: UvrB/UvrC motif-containing protein [Anaerococcus]MDU3176413.1 UvrB/UvrC motif-containing protein [Anaerococcus sp.]